MSKAFRRQPVNLAWVVALLLPVLYVLSYAPVYSVVRQNTNAMAPYGASWVIYRPVDWLIDHTPLDGPLLTWANLWGVRMQFEIAADARAIKRGKVSPDMIP
jgi:hypothetical protein